MRKTLIIAGTFLVVILLVLGACAPTQYTLTTSVSPSGGGTISPASGTYDDGTEVTLIANPASGYRFDRWSGNAAGTSSSVTIVMDGEKSVTAHFIKVQYTLTTSVSPSGGGTISPASGTYDDGTEVTLTAIPAEGYVFDYWSGDASGTSNSETITVDSEKSVVANFKAIFMSTDGRIGFDLNEIERTQTWPDEFESETGGRSPKAGYDFVVVRITVAFLQGGHINPMEMEYVLIGDNNARYEEPAWSWAGIQFADPLNLSSSARLAEGASVVLVFEIPVSVEAVRLGLSYDFREAYKAPQFEEGHVDILLN